MAASTDDEDAPESFSLQDSKRTIKRQAANLLHFEASEREKKRARNRERDKRLKEQAKIPKRRLKDAEARMDQAMRDAEEYEHGEGEEHSSAASENERMKGQSDSSDGDAEAESIREDQGEHVYSDQTDSEREDEKTRNPDHLPDHLFVSAFSKPTTTDKSISKSSKQIHQTTDPRRRSKKHSRSAKDIIVGYDNSTSFCQSPAECNCSTRHQFAYNAHVEGFC